jgi:hypothetical protein
MAWQLSGQLLDTCSCKLLCPCTLGPAEPDQGWCAGALLFDIEQGNSDGVNLAASRVVMAFEMPGDFLGGNLTARLYLSDAATADQRRELEAIFGGQKGGAFAAMAGMIVKVLPTQTTSISFSGGDSPSVTIGNVGRINLARVKAQSGKQTTINNAMVFDMFGIPSDDLARGDGSQWSDPDLRSWQSGGQGGIGRFSLSA